MLDMSDFFMLGLIITFSNLFTVFTVRWAMGWR